MGVRQPGPACRGGTPPWIPPAGGYPTSGNPPGRTWLWVPLQGVTHLRYPPIRPGWGVPHLGYPLSDLAGGCPLPEDTPPQVTPPIRPGWGGTPPSGTPPPCQTWLGGGYRKQMEYLIRRGRYASCVHAGGLSC